ncbi:MAG: IS1 family transposase [Actinomycetota bacterium]|nr:IS1 family transposase [Actinomycetota bacterium]
MANVLSTQKRAAVVRCLVEGNSIRATVRITGVAKNTVTKLLVDLGQACSNYQNRVMKDLPCERLQVDEIWSFVYAKKRNVPDDRKGEYGMGDVYTWTAIDADTKLVPTWLVGERTLEDGKLFMEDLAGRLANRVQLTTDGHKAYLKAVPYAFGKEIDHAVLLKLYGNFPSDDYYSPPHCVGEIARTRSGRPDPKHVSTSYVERQNLTMRMGMRRFTRLTNAFSKKVENLAHAVSLHYMHYNFCRVHQTLKTTPAVKAGVADHVWTIEELVGLLDRPRKSAALRGPALDSSDEISN